MKPEPRPEPFSDIDALLAESRRLRAEAVRIRAGLGVVVDGLLAARAATRCRIAEVNELSRRAAEVRKKSSND